MKRLIAAIMTIGTSVALAQTPQQIAEEEFTRGNTAYNLGKWDEAVAHFTRAYEASPQPELLYNIAQAYRQAASCKQALHFYKRFRSLKEADKVAPLSRRKRDEVNTFIKQLTECAAKADRTSATKPDTLATPAGDLDIAPPPPPPPPAPQPQPQPEPERTPVPAPEPVIAEVSEEPVVEEPEAIEPSGPERHVFAARALAGIAMLSAGDLDIPVQPSFSVVGGYPLAVRNATLELGAGISYTPLPYSAMGASKRATLLGVRAVASGHMPIAPRVSLRADAGIGALALRGLDLDNPWTEGAFPGSFTLFNVRFGVAADVALTKNLALTVSPFNVAWSPGTEGLAPTSIRQIEFLVGLGGRR